MAIEFDPGPPPDFAELFAQLPSYQSYRELFWYDWGPIFYRGRLDGSARALCVASDPGPTERLALRTLVGDAGQRVQGFLAKIGLTRSYLCLNAFAYALIPATASRSGPVMNDPAIRQWRNALFDKVKTPGVQAIIAFGGQAQDAVELWPGRGNLPVFHIPHPSSRDETKLLNEWRAAVTRLRTMVTPDTDADASIENYGSAFREEDYAPIPKRDLPWGFPDWFGDDSEGRQSQPIRRNSVARPIPDDRHTLIWTAPTTGQTPTLAPALDRCLLEGRIVTMDADFRVIERGLVAIEDGRIAAIQSNNDPLPPDFENAPRLKTLGTIYPGLMDLHNHLSYDILTLWDVPKKFSNRGQWGGIPEYRKLVSGPMAVLGRTPGYVEAIVRYVECKCLLGGVTTSQGIALFSNQGISRYYKGVVRNAEQTTEPDLPDARTSIADIEAKNVEKFFTRLQQSSCMLLHLSEGVDDAARKHFLALQMPDGEWAVTDSLAGIHSAGLKPEDFAIVGEKGGAMIWSPLSNLLLYGATADIKAAKESGVRIGIGADWSPSGSKNLLGELKIARLVSAQQGGIFTDREIVAMATRTAAQILKWDASLGSLEPGKRADLIVVSGMSGDPYAQLLEASEQDIHLVMIDGKARYGTNRLMEPFGAGTENWKIRGAKRVLNLAHEDSDPLIGKLSLRESENRLRDGLQRLPELAERLENPPPSPTRGLTLEPQWFLVLEQDVTEGEITQPLLPFGPQRVPTGFLPEIPVLAAAVPLSTILTPLQLDPLTALDDPDFLPRLQAQKNLSQAFKDRLTEVF